MKFFRKKKQPAISTQSLMEEATTVQVETPAPVAPPEITADEEAARANSPVKKQSAPQDNTSSQSNYILAGDDFPKKANNTDDYQIPAENHDEIASTTAPKYQKYWNRYILGVYKGDTVVPTYVKLGIAAFVVFLLGIAVASNAKAVAFVSHGIVDTSIAMVGNSYLLANDLPRILQNLGGAHITQDSCLHSSGSILNLLKTGNGMYTRWQTQNALIQQNVAYTDADGNSETTNIYDFGACSVPQLLLGQDDTLSTYNAYETYQDDGTNPCLVSPAYLEYKRNHTSLPSVSNKNQEDHWDYVIIGDHSKRMCFDDARADALLGLNYTYKPILERTGGIPVILQPHAFWSSSKNMNNLQGVEDFTAKIYQGAVEYAELLETSLPQVLIAPVGMVFLAVFEQDSELWNKLFLQDQVHPSPYGTYLYAVTIYATLFKKLPKTKFAIPSSNDDSDTIQSLFSNARKIQGNGYVKYPTQVEAEFMLSIVKEVVLQNKWPDSLPDLDATDDQYNNNNQEEQEEYNADDDADQGGGNEDKDHDGWYDYSAYASNWNNAQYSANYQGNRDYNANANGDFRR